MALKPFYTKIEDINEAWRGLYREVTVSREAGREEKLHVLDVEPTQGWALEDVTGLKSALGREKDDRRVATERASSLDAQVKTLEKKLAEKTSPEVKEQLEAAIKERDNHWSEQIKTKDTQLTTLKGKVENLLIDSELTTQLMKSGAKENMIPLLVAQAKGNTRVRQEGDAFHVEVLLNGYPVADKKISDLVNDFVSLYPDAFKGTGAGGSGAANQNRQGGSGGAGPKHRGDFKNAHEKGMWIKENGQSAFQELQPEPAQ